MVGFGKPYHMGDASWRDVAGVRTCLAGARQCPSAGTQRAMVYLSSENLVSRQLSP